MKKYHFMNYVHISTDLIGKHRDTWIPIGLCSYPEDMENHVNSYEYFNFNEVRNLIEKGLTTDNVYLDEKNMPKLHMEHLSAVTCFQVFNGIAFLKDSSKHQNLLQYCKMMGYVSDSPTLTDMMAGSKLLEKLDKDMFKITYILDYKKMGFESVIEMKKHSKHIEELIIGSLKILKQKQITSHSRSEVNVRPACNLGLFHFISDAMVLEIFADQECLTNMYFIHCLRQLDLQIYYFFHQKFEWSEHLFALMQCARDNGQSHWINEEEEIHKSNFEAYHRY